MAFVFTADEDEISVEADGAILSEINGVSLLAGGLVNGWSWPQGCELLPGTYKFCLSYRTSTHHSLDCVASIVTLLPGHVYAFSAAASRHENDFAPVFTDTAEQAGVSSDPRLSKKLHAGVARVDKYFAGKRAVSKPAEAIMESRSAYEADPAEVARLWDSLIPGNVVALTFDGQRLVAVVDRRKDDALIYFLVGRPGDTYRAMRNSVGMLKVLASSPEEYEKTHEH